MARKAANLRRRGNSWRVYFRVDGRQVQKSFADRDHGNSSAASKEAAELYLTQAHAELARGQFRVVEPRRFDGFADEWLGSHPSLDPRTRELYAQRIRDWLKPPLGSLKLSQIDQAHVRRVKERAAAAGLSGPTQRAILALLSGIMRYAIEQRLIVANPVAALPKRDRPKGRGKSRKRILTSDQLRQLLGAAPDRVRPIFAVAAYCGLRLSEVLGLVWGDIDFDGGTIRVRAQLSRPNAFDRSAPHRVETKSDSDEGSDRVVFLHDDLVTLLKGHRGDRIPRHNEFVFQTAAGTPFSQRNIARAFDQALESVDIEWTVRCAGCGWTSLVASLADSKTARRAHLVETHPAAVPADWKWSQEDKPTFHSLRHTFASAVIAGGADHGHVARLIGHTNPAFTYQVYVHEFDQARRHAESKAALGVAYAGVL
jgi:integrase